MIADQFGLGIDLQGMRGFLSSVPVDFVKTIWLHGDNMDVGDIKVINGTVYFTDSMSKQVRTYDGAKVSTYAPSIDGAYALAADAAHNELLRSRVGATP